MHYDVPAKPRNFCGRIHFGPICLCAEGRYSGELICAWCGCRVTRAEGEQVQRQWNTLRRFLDPIKQAMVKREKK